MCTIGGISWSYNQSDNKFYMLSQTNQMIFSFDVNSYNFNYVSSIDEMNMKGYILPIRDMNICNDRIYFFPMFDQYIYIYDIKTKQCKKKICPLNKKEAYQTLVCGNRVIIASDIDSFDYVIYDSACEQFVDDDKFRLFMNRIKEDEVGTVFQYRYSNNCIVLGNMEKEVIYIYDKQKECGRRINGRIRKQDYWNIVVEDDIWLFGSDQYVVSRYDYSGELKGSINVNQDIMFKNNPSFLNALKMGNYIYCANSYASNPFRINTISGEVNNMFKNDTYKIRKNALFIMGIYSSVIAIKNKVYFLPCMADSVLIYDENTGKEESIKLVIEQNEMVQVCKRLNENLIVKEGNMVNLESFIKSI